MLKITKLFLLSEQKVIQTFDFSQNVTFIKMGNSKGKTSLFLLIDYLLCSSSITLSQVTFSQIDYAEIETNHGIFGRKLFDNQSFTFRLRKDDYSQNVSEDYYKSQIENSCLEDDVSDRDSIRALAEENISYRTYTIFNFLDEHYLGQVEKTIFSKQLNPDYYRSKYIFDYVFNKQNIKKINVLKNEINALINKNVRTNIEKEFYSKSIDRARALFADLGLDFNTKNIEKNIESINRYESELLSSNSKIKESENYYYLWDVLNNITNTIRKLKEQSLSLKNQNELAEKRIILLKVLGELYSDTDNNEILSSISSIVKKCETISVVADSSDYSGTIKELEKHKREIQKELYKIKASNNDIDINTKRTKVAEARLVLQGILSYKNSETIDYEEEIRKKRKEIRDLRNGYDKTIEERISLLINHYYSSLRNKNYGFIEEDYKKNNFKLSFNYKKMMVLGYTTINTENGDQYDTITMLESMSRQTVIQLCTYFAFNQLFKEEYHFPIVSTLFLDNVSKPFENANKPIIYDLLTMFTREVKDFNVIVTTDCDEDNKGTSHYYKDGLNPFVG